MSGSRHSGADALTMSNDIAEQTFLHLFRTQMTLSEALITIQKQNSIIQEEIGRLASQISDITDRLSKPSEVSKENTADISRCLNSVSELSASSKNLTVEVKNGLAAQDKKMGDLMTEMRERKQKAQPKMSAKAKRIAAILAKRK